VWDEIEKYLPIFETAVLNVAGAEGYPYSIRCRPAPDRFAAVLRLDSPDGAALRAGPASLLCHSHEEYTWNQKILVLRGRLEGSGDRWVFRPEKFVPSSGIGGGLDMVRAMIGMRRTAAAYLKKRGLSRPRIPWREIEAVKERATR